MPTYDRQVTEGDIITNPDASASQAVTTIVTTTWSPDEVAANLAAQQAAITSAQAAVAIWQPVATQVQGTLTTLQAQQSQQSDSGLSEARDSQQV